MLTETSLIFSHSPEKGNFSTESTGVISVDNDVTSHETGVLSNSVRQLRNARVSSGSTIGIWPPKGIC